MKTCTQIIVPGRHVSDVPQDICIHFDNTTQLCSISINADTVTLGVAAYVLANAYTENARTLSVDARKAIECLIKEAIK